MLYKTYNVTSLSALFFIIKISIIRCSFFINSQSLLSVRRHIWTCTLYINVHVHVAISSTNQYCFAAWLNSQHMYTLGLDVYTYMHIHIYLLLVFFFHRRSNVKSSYKMEIACTCTWKTQVGQSNPGISSCKKVHVVLNTTVYTYSTEAIYNTRCKPKQLFPKKGHNQANLGQKIPLSNSK